MARQASQTNQKNNPRYERKFYIEHIDKYQVDHLIRLHPAMFVEIYHSRQINNIYFDTCDNRFYHENINGDFDRVKVRIRWYGQLQGAASQPTLELKIKKGPLGYKESYRLGSFQVDNNLSASDIRQVLQRADLPENLKHKLASLEPVIFNSYSRKYYLSSTVDLRLTIDWAMACCRFDRQYNTFALHRQYQDSTIVELKYDADKDRQVRQHCQDMPFTMTKSSKYVNAIEKLFY
ncbi:MAG: polyphosphate polymerase domain-containing protein [Phycisphaerae bacterium]|nr:polyphosphate polymerase domain-containing protein [Phycisphaerae bacterium]